MAKQKIKFLIVDDLEGNLLVLDGLLRREGLELLKARSGPEALELLLIHEVALAIVDVQMPGMNGFELAELMRGTERTRRVPIMFVTAGAVDTQRRFRGYEAGAVDFLFKPIEPHILQSKAEVFFELACQRDELRAAAEENARLLADSRRNEEELLRIRDELAMANISLEAKVQERTARLRETITELEHFSYTITHDMRAPLRAMQGFGQMLVEESGQSLSPQAQDYLNRITTSANRMDKLITDSLNYSKVLQHEFELQPVDARKLLLGIVESYPNLQPPQAQITLDPAIPVLLANEAGLTQCFSNLLGNAVKFMKPGVTPTINVRSEAKGDCVRLWFEDNGIGIAKRHQEQIFRMFQRVSRDYEGTGIGLALVRKVVERMRGRVGVESEEGKGSRFWLEFKVCR